MNCSSHITISLSRWLVGSSSIRTSAGLTRVFARAILFFCPPERVLISASKSLIPSFVRIFLASASVASGLPRSTYSRIESFSAKSGAWARYVTVTSLPITTCPSSGELTPATIFKNVDFPVPLTPITPILSPLLTPSVT